MPKNSFFVCFFKSFYSPKCFRPIRLQDFRKSNFLRKKGDMKLVFCCYYSLFYVVGICCFYVVGVFCFICCWYTLFYMLLVCVVLYIVGRRVQNHQTDLDISNEHSKARSDSNISNMS